MEDILPNPTFADLGLDAFGQSPLQFRGAEVNQKALTLREVPTTPNFIQSGDLTQKINVTDGWIQSENFVTGVSGWRISADGTSEFN